MAELLICVPFISVWTVRTFQEVLLLFIWLNFLTCIPQPLQVRIPASKSQSKP